MPATPMASVFTLAASPAFTTAASTALKKEGAEPQGIF